MFAWWKKWRLNIRMFDFLASSLKHNNRFLHLCWIVQRFMVQCLRRSIKKPGFLFYWIISNWKHTCTQSYIHLAINIFKAVYNYPTVEKFIFPCALPSSCNSFIFTLLCENRKRTLILSDAVAKITELWEAELPDSLILIGVLPGISVVVRRLSHF